MLLLLYPACSEHSAHDQPLWHRSRRLAVSVRQRMHGKQMQGPRLLRPSACLQKGVHLSLEGKALHHVGEVDAKVVIALDVEGGDLDRHCRILGARERKDIDVGRDILYGAHGNKCHQSQKQ